MKVSLVHEKDTDFMIDFDIDKKTHQPGQGGIYPQPADLYITPCGVFLCTKDRFFRITISDLTEIESATLSFRMNIEPQGFSGTCAVTLYLGTLIDVFNDPDALVLSSKKVLPTTFELSSSDRRLLFYLQHEEFYLAYKVVLEPLSLTSRQVSASGVIENLSVEIKGTQGLR